jgi:hypothetical protein
MNVKRIPDPTGLLPDIIMVRDLGPVDFSPGTPAWDALTEIADATQIVRRLNAIRGHENLRVKADELEERLSELGILETETYLQRLEQIAFYQDAASKALAANAGQSQREQASRNAAIARRAITARRCETIRQLAKAVSERIRQQGQSAVARSVKANASNLNDPDAEYIANLSVRRLKDIIR